MYRNHFRISNYLETELWSLKFPTNGEDVAAFATLETYRGRKFIDLFTDPGSDNEVLLLALKLFFKHAKVSKLDVNDIDVANPVWMLGSSFFAKIPQMSDKTQHWLWTFKFKLNWLFQSKLKFSD